MATASLTLESVIGFEGKIGGGLVLHPGTAGPCVTPSERPSW